MTTHVLNVMNLPFTIVLNRPGENDDAPHGSTDATERDESEQAVRSIHATLTDIDLRFSPYRRDSLVRRFQRGEYDGTDVDFQDVYMRALLARAETGGLFDPFFAGRYDPTGLVKGWAVDRAFAVAIRPLLSGGRLRSAAINAGGDMLVDTRGTDAPGWMIGIEDPHNTRRLLAAFRLRSGAVATSGISKRGEHVVRHRHEVLQATVVANSTADADVWATALLSAPVADIAGMTKHHALRAFIVTADGNLIHYDRGAAIPMPATSDTSHTLRSHTHSGSHKELA